MPAPEDQPDAEPITRERFNGLMSAHQRALAENRDLQAQVQAAAQQGQGNLSTDSQTQPEYEDGVDYRWDGTHMVPQAPPTPRANGAPREFRPIDRDDGSAEYATNKLYKELGIAPPKTSWP